MQLAKSLLVASLALASSLAVRAESSAQSWLENYYQNPQPSKVVVSVYSLSDEGYFTTAGQPAIAIGFFSKVFAQNSDKVDQWFAEFRDLPLSDRRLMAAALWQSGNEKAAKYLREVSVDSSVSAEINQLASRTPAAVASTPVLSPSSMNLQWGAFLASGDQQYITNILAALGRGERDLNDAARYALAEHAAAHPAVLAICREQLGRQPAEVRTLLQAALQDAEAHRQPAS
jgi:hypothetical protein